MSRIAKAPIELPSGVAINVAAGGQVNVKGPKGTLEAQVAPECEPGTGRQQFCCETCERFRHSHGRNVPFPDRQHGVGVTDGFAKKLTLVGVGYRAQVQGETLTLALGYSHPIEYKAPNGVTIEAPSQTEVIVSGCDKQRVGQVASEIRAFRPPEPYKGKGVRYSDERVIRKEAKKA